MQSHEPDDSWPSLPAKDQARIRDHKNTLKKAACYGAAGGAVVASVSIAPYAVLSVAGGGLVGAYAGALGGYLIAGVVGIVYDAIDDMFNLPINVNGTDIFLKGISIGTCAGGLAGAVAGGVLYHTYKNQPDKLGLALPLPAPKTEFASHSFLLNANDQLVDVAPHRMSWSDALDVHTTRVSTKVPQPL